PGASVTFPGRLVALMTWHRKTVRHRKSSGAVTILGCGYYTIVRTEWEIEDFKDDCAAFDGSGSVDDSAAAERSASAARAKGCCKARSIENRTGASSGTEAVHYAPQDHGAREHDSVHRDGGPHPDQGRARQDGSGNVLRRLHRG